MMKSLLLAVVAAAAFGNIVVATPARAEPACPQQHYYDPVQNACKLGSRPINGYDPYDPSGKGFLRGLGPDSSWEESQPTVTNPQAVHAGTTADLYRLICSDLDVNGVSVASVEDIYHVLYEAPYTFTGRDAGRAVGLAVDTTCPRHQPAMNEAMRQATS